MYDKKPVKGQVMGQSLGYGFVQFREHDHALGTLRALNNNPNVFGSHKASHCKAKEQLWMLKPLLTVTNCHPAEADCGVLSGGFKETQNERIASAKKQGQFLLPRRLRSNCNFFSPENTK